MPTIANRNRLTHQFGMNTLTDLTLLFQMQFWTQILEGDKTLSQRRIHLLRPLTVFETTPAVIQFTQEIT